MSWWKYSFPSGVTSRMGIMVKATGRIIQWIAQRTENPIAILSIVACSFLICKLPRILVKLGHYNTRFLKLTDLIPFKFDVLN